MQKHLSQSVTKKVRMNVFREGAHICGKKSEENNDVGPEK